MLPYVFILSIVQIFSGTLATPTYLNLTAISAAHGKSTLECWQLSAPIAVSSTPGTIGTAVQQLGNASNASYTLLPAKFDGGTHRAPAVQYVAFVSGLAHISLPDSAQEAWVRGGKNGLIIAADTAAVSKDGHITEYPSDRETVALQIPTLGGEVPAHRVLHEGACRRDEMML
ncbi:MAG: hypothetical protein Q9187_006845 [Circinaria calcarea]